MQKLTIYVAKDGTRFDYKQTCERYEKLCSIVSIIMWVLGPKLNLQDNKRRAHNSNLVKGCWRNFILTCADTIPLYKDTLTRIANCKGDLSQATYIIGDYAKEFPYLKEMNADNKDIYKVE